MLDTIASDDFKPLLNDEFETSFEGESVSLKLSSVDVMDESHSLPGARLAFSMIFLGPLEPFLPQGTYELNHAKLGALGLFMVPLGPDENKHRYEVIFN